MVLRVVSAARRAVPGVGSSWVGLRFAPTSLRCSRRGRAAKLAALTAFVALEQSRRVRRTKRATRADPGTALLAAPQVAHPGYRPLRCNARGVPRQRARWGRQGRGWVCVGSDICGAEERRARGRARERASSSYSSRLSERSERSERSEFRDGRRDRAPQGTLRAAKGCRIRAPAHTRPRPCLAKQQACRKAWPIDTSVLTSCPSHGLRAR